MNYSECEDELDRTLELVKTNSPILVIRRCEDMDDYFGWSQEGGAEMPSYTPSYIGKMYFKNDEDPYPLGLFDPEYYYIPRYIPILKAIVKGLVAEMEWALKNDYERYATNVRHKLNEYQEQLDVVQMTT